MTDRFDDQLERELEMSFARVDARPPLEPRYLAHRSRVRRWAPASVLAAVPAILTTKAAVVLAAVAIAGTGMAAKTALTGNPDPLSWGHHPTQQRTQTTTPTLSPGSPPPIQSQPARAHTSPTGAGAHDGAQPTAGSPPSEAGGATAGANPGHDGPLPTAAAKGQAEAEGNGGGRQTPLPTPAATHHATPAPGATGNSDHRGH